MSERNLTSGSEGCVDPSRAAIDIKNARGRIEAHRSQRRRIGWSSGGCRQNSGWQIVGGQGAEGWSGIGTSDRAGIDEVLCLNGGRWQIVGNEGPLS
jgi:hypothetical protein